MPANARTRSGNGSTAPPTLADLSLDLIRIATALSDLAARAPISTRHPGPDPGPTFFPPPPLDSLIAERQSRAAAFGLDLVNPGWTLLLTLYRAHLQPHPLRFSRLAAAARVPMTTAIRWLDRLEAAGLAERRPDPAHATGVLVALTPKGAEAMQRHFLTAEAEAATR